MKFNLLNRKIHYRLSIAVAAPVLIIIVSGIFLQTKKHFAWIQPAELRGASTAPTLALPQILEISKTVAEAEIKSWDDINRLDVRPSRGMLKVRANNNWEIQIDTQTGAVWCPHWGFRGAFIIESFHDGSFFSDIVKSWIFLPSAVVLLILWLTGIYLFILPFWIKRRRKSQNRER